jgi:hypothetical protein
MGALVTLPLAGCLTATANIPAYEHFDACSNQSSFHNMVTCGKTARQAFCTSNKSCTPAGDAIVAYAESLDQSVQRREMSEPEAQRKWIEFRMARANDVVDGDTIAVQGKRIRLVTRRNSASTPIAD